MTKNKHLRLLVDQTCRLHKCLGNTKIDKKLPDGLWRNLTIIDKHKTCLIKFQIRQYIGKTCKQFCILQSYLPLKNMPYLQLI